MTRPDEHDTTSGVPVVRNTNWRYYRAVEGDDPTHVVYTLAEDEAREAVIEMYRQTRAGDDSWSFIPVDQALAALDALRATQDTK